MSDGQVAMNHSNLNLKAENVCTLRFSKDLDWSSVSEEFKADSKLVICI